MSETDLGELERFVLAEIESYEYTVPEGALGKPFPDTEVEALVAGMRAALVKPEWHVVQLRDTVEQLKRTSPERRRCVLVADDGEAYRLYYDPVEEDFFLAVGNPPETFGVRGDAVGCWMSR